MLTTFVVDATKPRAEWVVMILPVVDEHHGLRSEWSSYVIVDVYGVAATPRVRAAVEQLGSFEIHERADGFCATRAGAA